MSQANYSWGNVAEVLQRYAVLFVDDEEPNRIIFKATFEPDFSVICAKSGDEALEILRRERVDVLVTDHRMPGLSGVGLCGLVRKRYPEVQRILVTAYTDLATATTAINRGGVSRYVTKPWDVDELRGIIDHALAEAVLSRTVRMLQSTMLMKERLAGVAAARGRILHDLANLSLVISVTSGNLFQMMTELESSVDPKFHADLMAELHDQRTAVEHLQQLHTRVRNLGVAGATEPAEQLLCQLLNTVKVLTRGQAAGVDVVTECSDDATYYADPTDVARILVNLVTNASQAMRGADIAEPRITMSATVKADHVDVLVSDNGPGIPDRFQSRIFEGFFTTRAAEGGSGLGLAICVELAESNGGSIKLLRSRPGMGTTFRLRLPTTQQTAPT